MGCKKCGECCKWVYWESSAELTPVMKLKGFIRLGPNLVGIPRECSLLDMETGLCKDYYHRPQECRGFPESGEQTPEVCRYYKED